MKINIANHELGLLGCLFFTVVLFFNIYAFGQKIKLLEIGTQIWNPLAVVKEFLLSIFWTNRVRFK